MSCSRQPAFYTQSPCILLRHMLLQYFFHDVAYHLPLDKGGEPVTSTITDFYLRISEDFCLGPIEFSISMYEYSSIDLQATLMCLFGN